MFLKKIIILSAFTLTAVLLQSCSETPTDAGSGLLNQDLINVKTLDSYKDSLNIETSYFKKSLSLGTSTTLLLGKKDNIEAGILIRFNFAFPDTLTAQINNSTVAVQSGWIQMVKNYTFGFSTDPLNLSVHRVTSAWTTAGFNSDSTVQFDAANSDSGYTIGDSLTTIHLNQQLVNHWVKTAADTNKVEDYGAYIRPEAGTSKVLGYYALGSSDIYVPLLYVVYQTQNGLDTVSYASYADLSFISGTLPAVSPTNIVVQAGLEVISKLKFDINAIPSNAIINKADLTVTKDTNETFVGDDYSNSLVAFFAVDSVSADSLTKSIILSPSNNTYTGDVTYFVQEWVRKNNNAGLLLFASSRYNGVERYALKGANSNPADRPRLIITYTVKQ